MTNQVKQSVEQQANEKQHQTNSTQTLSVSSFPIMKQYVSLKAQHPDAILLFRVGVFYEIYHEDAVKASKLLGIALTKNKEGFELTAFPHHALDIYLPKLIRAGARVAIYDQLETPQKDKVEQAKPSKNTADNAKQQRVDINNKVVEIAGKNNHHAFILPLTDHSIKVENDKGKEVLLSNMQVLRGRVTFHDTDGNKLQLRHFTPTALDHLGVVIPPIVQAYKKTQEQAQEAPKTHQSLDSSAATSEQQQKFINEIKQAMGEAKMVVLPDFGTRTGVVAGTDEDKAISINRVYAWKDNVSFAGSVSDDDLHKRKYYHPENIRPEFYSYLIGEIQKATAPQLITENGQKVTAANIFESPKEPGKYLFYARLDGIGLHPKVVHPDDANAFFNKVLTIKDLFSKYYPTKLAKRLSKEAFDNLTLSNGQNLSFFRIYKQRNEANPHFGEYLLYAEMGQKRYHATPVSHDILDAYFDRTSSKAQIAELVIGEQLHLKSAYEKYKLPEASFVQEIRIRKSANGDWIISASMGEKGQTPERKLSNNDLYALFKAKTATREQLCAKYLSDDIKTVNSLKPSTQNKGLKR